MKYYFILASLFLFSCNKDQFAKENQVSLQTIDDCELDVGKLHNRILNTFIGQVNSSELNTYFNNLDSDTLDSMFYNMVDSFQFLVQQESGILLNRDSVAHKMYAGVKFVSEMDNIGLNNDFLSELPISVPEKIVLLQIDSLIDLYYDNPTTFEIKIKDLKTKLPNSLRGNCNIIKSFEISIATNQFWNDLPQDQSTISLRWGGLSKAQKADVVGFVKGAYDGAKWGAIAAGGIPGVVAGGLMGGAAYALGGSAVAHFCPDCWWNPFS